MAVANGMADLAIANSYYYGYMEKQVRIAKICKEGKNVFPNQNDRGVHINMWIGRFKECKKC